MSDRFKLSVRRPQIVCVACGKVQEVEIRSSFLLQPITVSCRFCGTSYQLSEVQDCMTGKIHFWKEVRDELRLSGIKVQAPEASER